MTAPAPGVATFALAWSSAMEAVTYVPMTWAEKVEFLTGQAADLARAFEPGPYDPLVAHRVGRELAYAEFVAPEALARTVTVLNNRLLADLDLAGPEVLTRLREVVESLVTGHTHAVRDRALDGQEAIRRADLAARERAERELDRAQARLRHTALHDQLTGLPNRALFTHRMQQIFGARSATDRLAVCILGLDGFKSVNDSLGPHVGDRLIAAVAARLADFAAEYGCLLARLDGDGFGLLIEDTTCADDAVKVADRALTALGRSAHVEGHDLPVRASAGIVERTIAGASPAELMRAAQISLHWAKVDGGSRWVLFDAARNAVQVARYRLSAAMPGALARGEFTLAFQPLVDLASGAVVGAEALARWQHPALGSVPPTQFIPLAEDTGLIVPLGLRLLEEACRQAVHWHGTGPEPYVSVNLAARQIRDPGLVARVAEILDRTGLPPSRLHLELTESTVFATGEGTEETLRSLADAGIRLAIDDFGTGYANHAYLPGLPVHELKLAGTFAARLRRSPGSTTDTAVMANLIALGHLLNLTVTAEGIETGTEADRLRGMGCDLGQGWHFGRPMSADRLSEFLY